MKQSDATTFLMMCLRQPKVAMRAILGLGLPVQAIWIIFAIVMIANTLADAFILSLMGEHIQAFGIQLEIPSPFAMLQSKVIVLLAVALALCRFSFDITDRSLRFYEVLLALLLYRALAAAAIVIGMVLFFVGAGISSLFLLVAQIYLIWLVANYTSVVLGDIPVGNALFLLFIALVIGMVLLLFVMVIFSLLFGAGL